MNREVKQINEALDAFLKEPTQTSRAKLNDTIVAVDKKVSRLQETVKKKEYDLIQAEKNTHTLDDVIELEENAKQEALQDLGLSTDTLIDGLKNELLGRLSKNYTLSELEAIEQMGKEKFPKFNYKEAYQK